MRKMNRIILSLFFSFSDSTNCLHIWDLRSDSKLVQPETKSTSKRPFKCSKEGEVGIIVRHVPSLTSFAKASGLGNLTRYYPTNGPNVSSVGGNYFKIWHYAVSRICSDHSGELCWSQDYLATSCDIKARIFSPGGRLVAQLVSCHHNLMMKKMHWVFDIKGWQRL